MDSFASKDPDVYRKGIAQLETRYQKVVDTNAFKD